MSIFYYNSYKYQCNHDKSWMIGQADNTVIQLSPKIKMTNRTKKLLEILYRRPGQLEISTRTRQV